MHRLCGRTRRLRRLAGRGSGFLGRFCLLLSPLLLPPPAFFRLGGSPLISETSLFRLLFALFATLCLALLSLAALCSLLLSLAALCLALFSLTPLGFAALCLATLSFATLRLASRFFLGGLFLLLAQPLLFLLLPHLPLPVLAALILFGAFRLARFFCRFFLFEFAQQLPLPLMGDALAVCL